MTDEKSPPPPPPPPPPVSSQQEGEGEGDSPPDQAGLEPQPPRVMKHTEDLSYMHRPPRIVPNYGKRPRGVLPKSSVSRVLLYDNVTQEQMLHVKMTHLRTEERKTGRLMDLHRKSFIVRRLQKQKHVDSITHHHAALSLPPLTITNGTGNAGKARATRRPARKAKGENSRQEQEEEAEVEAEGEGRGERLAPTGREEDGGERSGEGLLPTMAVSSQRHGARTSHGFALPPAPTPQAQRGPHTAAAALRHEGYPHPHHTLSDLSPRALGPGGGRKALVHMETDAASGVTRVMHTFKQQPPAGADRGRGRGGGRGRKGGEAGEERTTEDERYRKLERLLVRIDPPNEGYLELSPSFHCPRKTMTFTRPSSIHSSSVPQGHVVLGSWLSSVL